MASSSLMFPNALHDDLVALEALVQAHRPELAALALDPELWRFSPVDALGGPYDHWFGVWFDRALREHEAGREVAYVVRRAADGAVVGSTRFLNIVPEHGRLEVGHTHYAPDARGTYVNLACKRLLFAHAFETLGLARVELKCDARNVASRRAIAKVGAREEGTLRRHMVLGDGYRRDTVYFSVLDSEWPAVRAGLDARLADASAIARARPR